MVAFVRWLIVACLAVAAALAASVSIAQQLAPIPPLVSRVTDTSATLNMAEQQALDQKLREFESKTGGQIAILLVPTAEPETIDQYALRVAESWKIGKKGKDNGALIVMAMKEKKVRIEVGYGWEGTVPDVEAKRIIREVMTPYFKQNQFANGLAAALDKLQLAVTKDPTAVFTPDWQQSQHANTQEEIGGNLLSMLPILLGGLLFLSFILPAFFVGVISGAGALMFTGSAPTALALGVGAWFAAGILKKIFGGLRNNVGASPMGSRAYRRGGVGPGIWIPGGFGGGGGGFGGGGSDIFSGGGGTFGGGGASGGWGDGD